MNKTYACVGALALAAAAAAALAQPPHPPRPFKSIENNDAAYQAAMTRRADRLAGVTPVTDQTLRAPAAGDWLMWRRTYDGQGFSPLKQINRKTAAALTQAWSLDLPSGPNEITPLVHDGVIFIASGGKVQAIDGVSGDLLWEYSRAAAAARFSPASAVVRSIAIYEDKVIVPTPDRHVVALDVKSGKVVWDHEVLPASEPGPRLSGGPLGARGHRLALGQHRADQVDLGLGLDDLQGQVGEVDGRAAFVIHFEVLDLVDFAGRPKGPAPGLEGSEILQHIAGPLQHHFEIRGQKERFAGREAAGHGLQGRRDRLVLPHRLGFADDDMGKNRPDGVPGGIPAGEGRRNFLEQDVSAHLAAGRWAGQHGSA